MTRPKNEIPTDELINAFEYRPEEGRLYWRIAVGKSSPGKLAGWIDGIGYRLVKLNGTTVQVHRAIWFLEKGYWPSLYIDHINCIKDDNRIVNLREATAAQNRANTPARRGTYLGIKGVWPTPKRLNSLPFCSRIQKDGKKIHLGYFATIAEASAAYERAAIELNGEFAFGNGTPRQRRP